MTKADADARPVMGLSFNSETYSREELVELVERIALQNAVSIAGLLLTTDAAVVEIKEKKDKGGPGAGGGMDDFDY